MTEYHPAGSCDACATPPDPLDLVTWPQFRAAFQIAALALTEIEGETEDQRIVNIATDALRAMTAEVGRFDLSEPSWNPALIVACDCTQIPELPPCEHQRKATPEPAPKEG